MHKDIEFMAKVILFEDVMLKTYQLLVYPQSVSVMVVIYVQK